MEEVASPAPVAAEVSTPEITPEAQGQETGEPRQETGESPGDKPAKTPEQRELDRARRKIDRLVRQREELRAQVLTQRPIEADNRPNDGDSDRLTLSRDELQKFVEAEAKRLAPTLKEQQSAIEHRQKVVSSLAKEWGSEKFDSLASDLDEAFGGLADQKGQPKPATDAIFEADDPKALIEYLADPENAEEAEALGRMGPIQAGRAIAKLELRLESEKAKGKPQASKAAAPLEPVKASGAAQGSDAYRPDFTPKQFAEWYRKQAARKK